MMKALVNCIENPREINTMKMKPKPNNITVSVMAPVALVIKVKKPGIADRNNRVKPAKIHSIENFSDNLRRRTSSMIKAKIKIAIIKAMKFCLFMSVSPPWWRGRVQKWV
jgi:hypothetical protein